MRKFNIKYIENDAISERWEKLIETIHFSDNYLKDFPVGKIHEFILITGCITKKDIWDSKTRNFLPLFKFVEYLRAFDFRVIWTSSQQFFKERKSIKFYILCLPDASAIEDILDERELKSVWLSFIDVTGNRAFKESLYNFYVDRYDLITHNLEQILDEMSESINQQRLDEIQKLLRSDDEHNLLFGVDVVTAKDLIEIDYTFNYLKTFPDITLDPIDTFNRARQLYPFTLDEAEQKAYKWLQSKKGK